MTHLSNLKTLSEKIEHILENYKRSRDSDAILIKWLFYLHYEVDPQESFDKVLFRIQKGELPCFESIRRSRQKIQEQGKQKASTKTQQVRSALENDVKQQIREW